MYQLAGVIAVEVTTNRKKNKSAEATAQTCSNQKEK
jgi:hypothetical protein